VFEYTPAEIKRAVVGYGRAEKPQVQHMIKLLLGLADVPSPHDAADALAVAICHVHARLPARTVGAVQTARSTATNWRTYRPASAPAALRRGKPASAPAALRRGKPASAPAALRRGKPASEPAALRTGTPASGSAALRRGKPARS